MKRINEFHVREPALLARELPDFEENVAQEFQRLERLMEPALSVKGFVSKAAQPIAALPPDSQLSIDTTQGNAIVVLPALATANFGKRFVLVKRSALNQIAVQCEAPTVLHNGGSFPTISAAGVRVFYCDSGGYYS